MKYKIEGITIQHLVGWIDSNKVDLSPAYQRNFIWSKNDQSDLIDTIIRGFPFPAFFMYEYPDGTLEMVDGQQRSRTIHRFVKGLIKSSKKTGQLLFKDCSEERILSYLIPVIFVSDLMAGESLSEFYVLINKKGKHLNTPEIHKSEFFDTHFYQLCEEVLTYQSLIDLDIFTEASSKRMNDRAFIEELIAYLKLGVKDKKSAVLEIYEDEGNAITEDERESLKERFFAIIDKIAELNQIQEIRSTRYWQKNDFYTLFVYINENLDADIELLKLQYRILVILSGSDENGVQYIRPSNEECPPLREYAFHCVSQSNSKTARDSRLAFFNNILKNKASLDDNEELGDVVDFLCDKTGNEELLELTQVGDYLLINPNVLN